MKARPAHCWEIDIAPVDLSKDGATTSEVSHAAFRITARASLLVVILLDAATAGQLEDAKTAYGRGEYEVTLRIVRPLAEQGNPEGQHLLGSMHAKGKGVPKDESEAEKWYRLAAEQGYASAQVSLGDMYFNGRAEGAILSPSDRESVEYGVGVPRYYAKAANWYRRAADLGHPPAHTRLSFMYTNGLGVAEDLAEAARLNRLAAEKDYAPAQYGLGAAYYGGYGVSKDLAEAAKWFRLAAEHGDSDSQLLLAHMYRNGEGVVENYVQSYFWLSLAASGLAKDTGGEGGRPERSNDADDDRLASQLADARRNLELLLSADHLREAQRLVRDWKPYQAQGPSFPSQEGDRGRPGE